VAIANIVIILRVEDRGWVAVSEEAIKEEATRVNVHAARPQKNVRSVNRQDTRTIEEEKLRCRFDLLAHHTWFNRKCRNFGAGLRTDERVELQVVHRFGLSMFRIFIGKWL